ncbi:MAG: matrixin family metalloprotease [Planctomycetes bacterium]|nr:matrixin family metalloprotease [Planctomycetota bacterium]
MKLSKLTLPAALVGAAAFLTMPRTSNGYVLLGVSLNASSTGFQVDQSSFTDAASNNNVAADANFPGATGAAMSCWKAAAEWASQKRAGNGNGDPSQNGGLGNGGSNFDFMYEGVANSAGGGTSCVISAGGFLGGGVFAVTGPSNNGWSITFDNSSNNGWNWVDGPGNETGGQSTDIQGIAAHEIGHALGLGHSADGNATMYAFTSQTGSYNLRTIETDDTNGEAAIYGTLGVSKPAITAISGNNFIGGVITITGTNFSSTGNEVWFTKNYAGATSGGPPAPVMQTGVSSSNGGTTINVTVPANSATGEVIVRQSGALSQSTKSAPFPLTILAGPPTPIITSFSPNPIQIIASPIPTLTINGIKFTGATSVQIGSATYSGSHITVLNDTAITVKFMPPPNEAGSVNVTVTGPSGTSPVLAETINLPAGNILQADPINPASGANVTFYYGTPAAGDYPLVAYSSCISPLPVPPYFTLSIGGCGDLNFLDLGNPTGANGIASQTVTVPSTFHGIAILQFIRYNPSLPYPLPVSNLSIINVP